MTLDQRQPSFPESERTILGAIILDNEIMREAAESLTLEEFYHPRNRRIYGAMLTLFDQDAVITPTSIANELRKADSLEAAGGLSYITSLVDGVPQFKSIAYYVSHLIESSKRRQMIKFGQEITQRGLEGDESESQLAEWMDSRVGHFRADSKAAERGARFVNELVDPQEHRFGRFHKGITDAVPTGFDELDSKLTGRGLIRGFNYILAARPSMGKTSLMLDIAENAASAGYLVYVATLEMPTPVLLDRIFAVRAGVPRWKISPGLSDLDLAKLMSVADDLRGLPLVIDDRSRSISDMRRAIRDMERGAGRPVDLIIADYLQLFTTGKSGTRNDQVGANSRGWQELCKETNAAGLLLSQLSRAHEQQNREPEMNDLRDSGEIEQDARGIFLLFGDKAEEVPGTTPPTYREVTLKCPKQGEGPLFRTVMPFNTQLVTFRSLGHIAPLNPSLIDYRGRYEN